MNVSIQLDPFSYNVILEYQYYLVNLKSMWTHLDIINLNILF